MSEESHIVRNFRRSESIAKLAEALAKAQGEMRGAARDSENPFFKSKYADLSSIWEACRGPLSSNGLAVMQFPSAAEGGVQVETLLAHSSGEWVAETLWLPVPKQDPQAFGTGLTYCRRYGLAPIVGVCAEDDDGNAAAAAQQRANVLLRDKTMAILNEAAPQGMDALRMAWKALSNDMRKSIEKDWESIKKVAAKADTDKSDGNVAKSNAKREPAHAAS